MSQARRRRSPDEEALEEDEMQYGPAGMGMGREEMDDK
jgi:hypothetical protein